MTAIQGSTRVQLSESNVERLIHVETFFRQRGEGNTFECLNWESLKYFIETEHLSPEQIFRAVGCKMRAEAQA